MRNGLLVGNAYPLFLRSKAHFVTLTTRLVKGYLKEFDLKLWTTAGTGDVNREQ